MINMHPRHIFYPRLITHTNFDKSKIISYGLIVYAKDTEECIIVQRLHSVEFLLMFTGQYRPSLIPLLIPNITTEEIAILVKVLENNELYKDVFLKMGYHEKDYDYAYMRFIESKSIIKTCINKYARNNILKWTFPKGRLSAEDVDGFSCACREFVEEVEHELPKPIYVSPDYIVIENVKTLGCKNIESRCWIYVVDHKFDLLPITNHTEVNDRKWVPLRKALQLINKESLYTPLNDIIKNC